MTGVGGKVQIREEVVRIEKGKGDKEKREVSKEMKEG